MQHNKTKMNSQWDRLLWFSSLIVITSSIAAYYYFNQIPTAVRISLWGVVLLLAIGLAVKTTLGQKWWRFARDAFHELYKVVWPNRQETIQNTLIVLAIVTVFAIIVWIFDALLLKFVVLFGA